MLGGLFLGAALGTALTFPYYPHYAAPPVVYQPPVVYSSPAYTGQVYVTSGSTYTTTPTVAAPQVQREVVYSNGRYILRFAIGNLHTTEAHVRRAWELLRDRAHELRTTRARGA